MNDAFMLIGHFGFAQKLFVVFFSVFTLLIPFHMILNMFTGMSFVSIVACVVEFFVFFILFAVIFRFTKLSSHLKFYSKVNFDTVLNIAYGKKL